MTPRHIAVVGSGALARSLGHSLAALSPGDEVTGRSDQITVTLLARDGTAVAELARTCRARAAVSGSPVSFAAEPLTDEVRTLDRLRPDVLVCCASAQSPYERTAAPSAWTTLVAEAGFGITLPLQATLAVRLARAVARVSPRDAVRQRRLPGGGQPAAGRPRPAGAVRDRQRVHPRGPACGPPWAGRPATDWRCSVTTRTSPPRRIRRTRYGPGSTAPR